MSLQVSSKVMKLKAHLEVSHHGDELQMNDNELQNTRRVTGSPGDSDENLLKTKGDKRRDDNRET